MALGRRVVQMVTKTYRIVTTVETWDEEEYRWFGWDDDPDLGTRNEIEAESAEEALRRGGNPELYAEVLIECEASHLSDCVLYPAATEDFGHRRITHFGPADQPHDTEHTVLRVVQSAREVSHAPKGGS